MGAKKQIGFFEKYLTLWVAICIAVGIGVGNFVGDGIQVLASMEIYKVNIPVALLIWLMIYPMMMQVDFSSIKDVGKRPKGLLLTVVVNWLIKPFTMAFFAWIFFTKIYASFISPEQAGEYIAGAILLGAAPCTAMVLVWGYLSRGNDGLTLVMVAINSLTMLVLYGVLGGFLLGVGRLPVPWQALLLSILHNIQNHNYILHNNTLLLLLFQDPQYIQLVLLFLQLLNFSTFSFVQ